MSTNVIAPQTIITSQNYKSEILMGSVVYHPIRITSSLFCFASFIFTFGSPLARSDFWHPSSPFQPFQSTWGPHRPICYVVANKKWDSGSARTLRKTGRSFGRTREKPVLFGFTPIHPPPGNIELGSMISTPNRTYTVNFGSWGWVLWPRKLQTGFI